MTIRGQWWSFAVTCGFPCSHAAILGYKRFSLKIDQFKSFSLKIKKNAAKITGIQWKLFNQKIQTKKKAILKWN